MNPKNLVGGLKSINKVSGGVPRVFFDIFELFYFSIYIRAILGYMPPTQLTPPYIYISRKKVTRGGGWNVFPCF